MHVFDALSEQFVDCAELVLLYKFYTFKHRLLAGELRQAVQHLHELFVDNSSPAEFHVVLFEEMIRVLSTSQQPLVGLDVLEDSAIDMVRHLVYKCQSNTISKLPSILFLTIL